MAFENLKTTGITYLLGKLKTVFLQIKDAVKSVNGELPDNAGDITINSVPYAQNLESDTAHRNAGAFIQRTSGGDSSVTNGDAWLMNLKGNNDHAGYVAEEISWNLTVIGDDDHITTTFNRDTFVNYVANSGTITLAFSTAWSADPALYGFTITGTPEAGDTITVVYVKEERGTITVANPQTFVSTGWNLFDIQNGYAKVVKYAYGYRIEGTYSTIKFATTPSGTQSNISVSSGNFDIPSDGYVIVTGGASDTAIYATWEDWTDGYSGAFEAYNASTIDLTDVMSEYFPNGLLKAGSVADEIDLNLGQAISRVERLSYTAENLATAQNSGREYEYDENYIYLARASVVTSSISVNGNYTVNDHGIEYFTTTALEVLAEVLYGNNLKNKLERDVLTISQQMLTSTEQGQVRTNIGAARASDVSAIGVIKSFSLSSSQKLLTVADNDTICPIGVSIINLSNGDSSDLPASNYKYGKAIVEKYATHRIFVTVHPIIGSLNVAFNRMDSSNAWLGWKTFVDNSNVYNGLDKTTAGFVLDARQGKKLIARSTIQSIVLRSSGTASSSSSSVNTYNSRKFSDYWMIGFLMYSSTSDSIIRDVKWIDSSHWSSDSVVQTIANHGVSLGSVSGIQFTYNSDTSVSVVTIGAGSLTNFEIVGLMKE